MLHHFPSKIDIVRAAVEHLHAKRLKAFRKAIDRMPRDETRVRKALEAYLEHVKHPMYVAFLELWIAARTDPELQAILKPAQEAFEQEWYRTAVDLFPGVARRRAPISTSRSTSCITSWTAWP